MNVQKRNRIVFLFVYFVAYILYVYINAYFPVYFEFASSIDISKLTIVLFTSYSFMFVKPIFAIFVDYRERYGKGLKRRFLLITSALLTIVSFIITIISLELLIIFTLVLGFNFMFVSMLDVIIDKYIVEQDTTKDKNILYIQFGAILGSIFPNLFFVASKKTSIAFWNQFFLIGIIAIIPIIPIVALLKADDNNGQQTILKEINDINISIKGIVLMSIFLFFAYSKNLYEWLLEPWAINRLGTASGLFSILMIIFTLLEAISLIAAARISYKFNRKHILLVVIVVNGIILTIAPFFNIFIFFILISVSEIFVGFFMINRTVIMIDLSKKQVLLFQLMASIAILSKVVFIPLGTALSAVVSTEIIIMIAGILLAISAIPVYFIEHEKS